MLRILGSRTRLCDGLTRREMLRAGGLGVFGLGLADFFRLRESQAARPCVAPNFGRAKSVILLFLYGSPSQLETFDPKPDAPEDIRGDFKSIRSSLPGLDVCELLPNAAKVMDRVCVVRSMSHPYPLHGVAFATTGVPAIDVPMELNPRDARHHPYIGSVVDYVERGRARPKNGDPPHNIALPFPFSSRRAGEVPRAGPYAAFLGSAYNPTFTDFHEGATGKAVKTLNGQTWEGDEPYVGVAPDARFTLAAATDLPAEMTLDRLERRRSLLEQFDAERRAAFDGAADALDRHRAAAFDLIGSEKVRTALDLNREARPLRESYGMTLFGQASLAARRLVEAGSRFVTVFWDEYGLAGSGWDTHWNHFDRMKDELTPGFDRALYGLITDLESRGLLDETLVLCLSEHGRTPKLTRAAGGGRDHWSRAYSVLLAGGGVARGKVVGKTDRIAGDVKERPVSPKDVLATTYHLLGIDPEMMLTDRTGKPVPLAADGRVLTDVLA
jgi:hypothetical protein